MMPGNIYTLLTQILKEFSQPIGDKSIVMMESPAHQIVPPFWYAIPELVGLRPSCLMCIETN